MSTKLTLKNTLSPELQDKLTQMSHQNAPNRSAPFRHSEGNVSSTHISQEEKIESMAREKGISEKDIEAYVNKRKRTSDVLNWLYTEFPKCFMAKNKKPLKIDVLEDVLLHPKFLEQSTFSKTAIRQAIMFYVSNRHYHMAVIKGGVRLNLDGQAAGEITQQHKDHAKARMEIIPNTMKEKRARRPKKNFKKPFQPKFKAP